MIDIKKIREDPGFFKKVIIRRQEKVDIDEIIGLDERRRKKIYDVENLKREKNKLSEEIGRLKKEKKDADKVMAKSKDLTAKIDALEVEIGEIEIKFNELLLWIPNIPHSSVPDEDAIVKEWGVLPKFDFEPLSHWDLGEALGIIDFKAAAKLAGSRFVLYKEVGALLERAMINFCLDVNTEEHGYKEISPPLLNNLECFVGAAEFPKLVEDMYQCKDDPLYLIPTAEVPLINLHREETLEEDKLPLCYTAYTACFRREAGSYGKDVRGMIRVHQFDKVELVKYTIPDKSYDELEKMVQDIEVILQRLGLPYRVKLLSASEMAFQSAKTYDFDVWSAGIQRWLEVSSVSNCEAFQARRANVRLKLKNGDLTYPHILNGSGVAFARTFIALIENNQTKDGKVIIPECLRPYMNGLEYIGR